jgi:ankyrin repeat protein
LDLLKKEYKMPLAIEEKLFKAITSENEQSVRDILAEFKITNELLETNDLLKKNIQKPSLEVLHETGFTPLVWAAMKGNVNIVSALLEAKADVDGRASDRSTPLMIAAQMKSHHCVNLLIKSKADPNLCGDSQRTALMFATMSGSFSSVVILLEAKADPFYDYNPRSHLYFPRASEPPRNSVTMHIPPEELDIQQLMGKLQRIHPLEMNLFKAVALDNTSLLKKTIEEIELIHDELNKYPQLDRTSAPSLNVKNDKGKTLWEFASLEGHKECEQFLAPLKPPSEIEKKIKKKSFFRSIFKKSEKHQPLLEYSESNLSISNLK